MTIDEGVIKYTSDWTAGPPPDERVVALLDRWRSPLFAAGLVGHDEEHDVGFGNISVRYGDNNQFIISGTQTGYLESTGGEHYALVTACDIASNTVISRGPVQASSEAMTHASLYELDPRINAVVHVHSPALWNAHKDSLPTTDPAVPYGTPEMAAEFRRLHAETPFGRDPAYRSL